MKKHLISRMLIPLIFIFSLSLQTLWADECSSFLSELQKELVSKGAQDSLSLKEMNGLNQKLQEFKKQVQSFSCKEEAFLKTKKDREEIRVLRIRTIQKMLMKSIKEEDGIALDEEYQTLTKKKFYTNYANSAFFNDRFDELPIKKEDNGEKKLIPSKDLPLDLNKNKIIINDGKYSNEAEIKKDPLNKSEQNEFNDSNYKVKDDKFPPKKEAPKTITIKNQGATKEYGVQTFEPSTGSCQGVIIENEAVNLDNARDQDTVGWCYAYTASDLLSFRLKDRISAVSLYDSGESIETDVTNAKGNGGVTSQAIRNYLKKNNGFCLEKNLPSSDFHFCTEMSYRQFLLNFFEQIKAQKSNHLMASNQCFAENVDKAFPLLGAEKLKQFTDQAGTYQLIEKIFDFHCKELSYPDFKPQFEDSHEPWVQKSELIKKIHKELNNKNVTGIGYHYAMINRDSDPLSLAHASVVVGRRQNEKTGKCEFLLRNSWGKNCSQKEDADLSCHKNCTSFGCRPSGHFWVAEDRLQDAIFNTISIRN